jgi:hypothetical protein
MATANWAGKLRYGTRKQTEDGRKATIEKKP